MPASLYSLARKVIHNDFIRKYCLPFPKEDHAAYVIQRHWNHYRTLPVWLRDIERKKALVNRISLLTQQDKYIDINALAVNVGRKALDSWKCGCLCLLSNEDLHRLIKTWCEEVDINPRNILSPSMQSMSFREKRYALITIGERFIFHSTSPLSFLFSKIVFMRFLTTASETLLLEILDRTRNSQT